MVRRFGFEGDEASWLTLVPLAARRRLDVAGLKLSLAGWQALDRSERDTLANQPVDDEEQTRAYRAFLLGCAARVGVAVSPLSPAEGDRGRWGGAGGVPPSVRARLDRDGLTLPRAWEQLDDDARYALWKCATAGRGGDHFPEVLRALADECEAPP
jgi:hypothetical protein